MEPCWKDLSAPQGSVRVDGFNRNWTDPFPVDVSSGNCGVPRFQWWAEEVCWGPVRIAGGGDYSLCSTARVHHQPRSRPGHPNDHWGDYPHLERTLDDRRQAPS